MRTLSAELMKLKRSRMPVWTAVAVMAAPTLSNVFENAGAGWTERTSWSAFTGLAPMTMGTWYGFLLFGLVTAFIFGREYAEGVAPSMLTVPARRESVVFSKLVVLAGWVSALTVLAVVTQCVWASALRLQGFAWTHVWTCAADTLTVALLIFLTLPLVALVAVASRGVFAPMIFSAFGFAAGMLGGIAGWSDWLPWAMPVAVGGTFLGALMTPDVAALDAGSWAIDACIFVLGVAALMLWVNRADSKV